MKKVISIWIFVVLWAVITGTIFINIKTNNEGVGFAPNTGYDDTVSVTVGVSDSTVSATNPGYFVIDPGQTDQESIVCSGVGSASLTNCVRGLTADGSNQIASTTLRSEHDIGSRVIMTNLAQFYLNFVNIWDAQTKAGVLTFSDAPVYTGDKLDATHATNTLSTIEYVNNVATSGVAVASETVDGRVELATQLEMASSTSLGGTGSIVQAKYSTSSPSYAGLWNVITRTTGKISQWFIDLTEDFNWTGEHSFSATTTFSGPVVSSGPVILNGTTTAETLVTDTITPENATTTIKGNVKITGDLNLVGTNYSGIKWEFISSDILSDSDASVQSSDTSAVPAGTKLIMYNANVYSLESASYNDQTEAQLILIPGVINSATSTNDNGDTTLGGIGVNVRVSGSVLTATTLKLGVGGGRSTYLKGTVYYFK